MAKVVYTVVVVNADIVEAESMCQILRSTTVSATPSSCVSDVLEAISGRAIPDLIITDLHLQDIDGWRFCHLLRSAEFKDVNDVPVIITSSIFLDDDLVGIARGLGVSSYLSLPCDDDNMRNTVKQILKDGGSCVKPVALVVDDDENILKLLSSGLKADGYDVLQSTTGKGARKILKKHKPDVFVIDHNLPDMDGLELISCMEDEGTVDDAIIVLITAAVDPDLAITYMRAGVDAYVRKPFGVHYLMDLINKSERSKALQRVESLLNIRTESLREAEKRYRDLYEDAPLGYHTLGSDGLVLSMNETELKWLGYDAEELIGKKSIYELQTKASASKGKSLFEELKTVGALNDVELDMIRKDGSIMPVVIQSKAVFDSDGAFLMTRTIMRDISDRKMLEAQLKHAQKMESLGIMAEGIAHNFNNMLTPILVNSSYLLEKEKAGTEDADILNDIADAARKGAGLVKQLTSLGRPADILFSSIDISAIVRETIDMLEKTLDKSIRIEVDYGTEEPNVTGNFSQVQQALLNLCFNAGDAMPDGGLLSVSVKVVNVSEESVNYSAKERAGIYQVVSVVDTGVGMTRDVQDKIFDPFFTTKGLAKGTGLGLSTAYAIVHDHGGFVHVYTEVGEGSRFSMYFPVTGDAGDVVCQSDGDAEYLTADGKSDEKTIQADELKKCILVVDDEKKLLSTAARVLRKSGFSVIEASDGVIALDAVRASMLSTSALTAKGQAKAAKIDLVLLDVVMPGMSGEKVLQRIRSLSKDLPVIVTSGFGSESRITDFLKQGAQNILFKPYDKLELLTKISETLDLESSR